MSRIAFPRRWTIQPSGEIRLAPEWAHKVAAWVCGDQWFDGRNVRPYIPSSGQKITPSAFGLAIKTTADSLPPLLTLAVPPNVREYSLVFVGRPSASGVDGALNCATAGGQAYLSSNGGLWLSQTSITSHYINTSADYAPRRGASAWFMSAGGNRGATYLDGSLVHSGTHGPSSASLVTVQCGTRENTSTRSWRGAQELVLLLNAEATEADCQALSIDPWQVFEAPRQSVLYSLPASGGSFNAAWARNSNVMIR